MQDHPAGKFVLKCSTTPVDLLGIAPNTLQINKQTSLDLNRGFSIAADRCFRINFIE
jgi:hypothetical protein